MMLYVVFAVTLQSYSLYTKERQDSNSSVQIFILWSGEALRRDRGTNVTEKNASGPIPFGLLFPFFLFHLLNGFPGGK